MYFSGFMNILLLAFGFPVQYRALCCAAKSGAKVFVLGGERASILRCSRYCARYIPLDMIAQNGRVSPSSSASPGVDLQLLKRQIENVASAFNIDIVLPCDSRATRLLSEIKDSLTVPVFPIPPTDTFDLLDDKWNFYRLCGQLGLPTPRTWLFQDAREALRAIDAGLLPDRLIAKPLRSSGKRGQVLLTRENVRGHLQSVNYSPVLIQEYIDGRDDVLTIFAIAGKTVAASCHYRNGSAFFFSKNDAFLRYASSIAAQLRLDGVYCFDARVKDNNEVYLLETNPRMYISMNYDSIVGFNFVEIGLRNWDRFEGEPQLATGSVKVLRGTLKALVTPWRIRRVDIELIRDRLSDPLAQLLDGVRLTFLRLPHRLRGLLRHIKPLRPLLE